MSTIKYLLIFSSVLFSSCATKYIPPFSPTEVNTVEAEEGKVSLFYEKASLNEKGNYARKARKKDYHFVQVSVVNLSAKDIQLSKENIQAFADYQPIEVIEPSILRRRLKQKKAWYFLYLIPGLAFSSERVYYFPVLAPIGIYNYIRASIANRKFFEGFMEASLLGQEVKAGQTARGWLCLRRKEGFDNVLLRYED